MEKTKNIIELLADVLDVSPRSRGKYLDGMSLSDKNRQEIESLLAFENESDDFMSVSWGDISKDFFTDNEMADSHSAGQKVGIYEIEKELGLGGMGAVYLARRCDGKFEQKVAVKYLGYSALCLAEGLADGGKVITLDVQEDTNAVARSFVAKTEFKDRIEFLLGAAMEMIPNLNETFDLVFIDADKPNYSNYYNLVFDKVRPGGFIIADNVLWSGKVMAELKDENAQALYDFSQMVLADDRVENVLLPIRDGLMVIRKKEKSASDDSSLPPSYELSL